MGPGELIERWYEEVWNKRNDDFVYKHMADDCQVDGLPRQPRSPEKFLQFRDSILGAITDLKVELSHCLAEGSRVLSFVMVRGTHKATGKAVSFRVAADVKIEDEVIVEAVNVVDFHSFLNQIGEKSQDSLNKALGIE